MFVCLDRAVTKYLSQSKAKNQKLEAKDLENILLTKSMRQGHSLVIYEVFSEIKKILQKVKKYA